MKIDSQPLRWLALGGVLLAVAAISLAACRPDHAVTYLNICGVLLSLVGGIFIASGVALNREQVAALKANYKPKKWLRNITDLALEASRVVTLGVVYLAVGAAFQIWSSYIAVG